MSRRLLFARLSSLLALLLAVPGATIALAQDVPPISWQRTPQDGPYNRIFTPASGALFVRGMHHKSVDLARSDDGGATWRSVPRPPANPADHQVGIVVDDENMRHHETCC